MDAKGQPGRGAQFQGQHIGRGAGLGLIVADGGVFGQNEGTFGGLYFHGLRDQLEGVVLGLRGEGEQAKEQIEFVHAVEML